MREPYASRPHMPGYGIRGPGEGSGLLPWAWAEQRLTAARNYWVTSPAAPRRPTTPRRPVVLEGSAEIVHEHDAIARVAGLLDAKYGGITVEFLTENATIRVRPHWAFAIDHDDFTGSATRWAFAGAKA